MVIECVLRVYIKLYIMLWNEDTAPEDLRM